MTVATPDVEVCIVAYGNEATIDECIASVGVIPGARVALCDNHPNQGSLAVGRRAAQHAGIDIRTESRPDNPGFAISCNGLARSSTAQLLFFLNPDAVVMSWPAKPARRHGVVAPRIVSESGRVQRAYGRRRTVWAELGLRLQLPPRAPMGAGYVSGAAMVIERALFEHVGGFDERYFMYYEDIDLCRSIVESGGRVERDESFSVRHIGGYSAASDPRRTALRSYESARRYYEKWTGSATRFDMVVLLDSALRAGLDALNIDVHGGPGARATLPAAWQHLRAAAGHRWTR